MSELEFSFNVLIALITSIKSLYSIDAVLVEYLPVFEI